MRKNRIIEWIPFYPDPVVWVSVAGLDASWSNDARYYVGVNGTGSRSVIPARYKKFGEWFAQGYPVWMPHVGLTNGHISFSDGRHRFAWLRDRGVKSLPVTVSPDIVPEMKRRFGTTSRTSSLPRRSGPES